MFHASFFPFAGVRLFKIFRKISSREFPEEGGSEPPETVSGSSFDARTAASITIVPAISGGRFVVFAMMIACAAPAN